MYDFIKKASYMGLGLAAMSKEKVEEMADEFTKNQDVTAEEGKKFAEQLKDESEKARKKLEDKIRTIVKSTLDRMDIPTRSEVNELKKRIKELEKQQKS